jgi:hypothetical protein
METIKLAEGEQAPQDADCIRVQSGSDGQYKLIAAVLQDLGDEADVESVSMIRGQPYASQADAEAAGMAWAADHGVSVLYIETMRREGEA